MLNSLSEVWRVEFWMQLHGGQCPKRTLCLSNGSWIQGLDLGRLPRHVREQCTTLRTARGGPIDGPRASCD